MILAYKTKHPGHNHIRLIDAETGEVTRYTTDDKTDFVFGEQYKSTVKEMGYRSAKEFLRELRQRGILGEEIDLKEQQAKEAAGAIWLKEERARNAEIRKLVA